MDEFEEYINEFPIGILLDWLDEHHGSFSGHSSNFATRQRKFFDLGYVSEITVKEMADGTKFHTHLTENGLETVMRIIAIKAL